MVSRVPKPAWPSPLLISRQVLRRIIKFIDNRNYRSEIAPALQWRQYTNSFIIT
jgi:hypothetical protein